MTPNNHSHDRSAQQDARAWAAFTGCSYQAALRQIQSPLAQGILGERISARQLIRTLHEHPVIGGMIGGPEDGFLLGENGFYSERDWSFKGTTDFIELALITDTLRMFSPLPAGQEPDIDSYSLKHTVEAFLSGTPASYVTNGRLIWCAAALGLPLGEYADGGPNLVIGIPEHEHDYLYGMVRRGQEQPKGHHYRPPGYEHLSAALGRHAAGEPIGDRWIRPEPTAEEPAPFHAWLLSQAGRNDPIGDLASDYASGVRSSTHRIAQTPDELVLLFTELTHSPEAYTSMRAAVGEWLGTQSPSPGIRTVQISSARQEVQGYGAGSGNVERFEYLCPCGDGIIVEEHDNIPGFREHSHFIECEKCRDEWRLVKGRSVYDWALEPVF